MLVSTLGDRGGLRTCLPAHGVWGGRRKALPGPCARRGLQNSCGCAVIRKEYINRGMKNLGESPRCIKRREAFAEFVVEIGVAVELRRVC